MFKQYLALLALLAVCFLHHADAIKCYQCRSLTDQGCAADKLDAATTIRQVDCDSAVRPNSMDQILPVTKCIKATAKDTKGQDKAGTIVIRDCHFETANQKAGECLIEHNLQVEKCHTCKGDLCNVSSAGRFVAMGVAAIFAVVAVNVAL